MWDNESRDLMSSSWREVATLHAKLDAVLTKKSDKGSRDLDVGELHAKLDALLDGSTRSDVMDSTFSSMTDLLTRSSMPFSGSTTASPTATSRSVRTVKPPSTMVSGTGTPAHGFAASRGCSGFASPRPAYRGYASPAPPSRPPLSGMASPRVQPRVQSATPRPRPNVARCATSPTRVMQVPAVSKVPLPTFLAPATSHGSVTPNLRTVVSAPAVVNTTPPMVFTWPALMLPTGPTMLLQSQVTMPVIKSRPGSRNGSSCGSSREATPPHRPTRANKICCG
mmetsp:Transcript_7431/g.20885  ORF Transcript_7431/g.20885 Transcript_7431/m.20885 type:complete len:281 (-) Transcript_7431:197-1039(-)